MSQRSTEPAIEQSEPELVAAVAEETFPSEPASEWELSKPLEAQGNLQTEVCEGMTDEGVAFPEIEEPGEVGEAGRQIQILPDKALQNVLVVWHPVEDFGGRNAVVVKLHNKTPVHWGLLDTQLVTE